MTGASWSPANDTERILYDAWRDHDTVRFLSILADAPLYLPGFANDSGPQRLLTWRHEERAYLLAFTSPEALYQGLTEVVDGWRLTSMAELIAERPDPESGIVVSPNTPIGAYLLPDELAEMGALLAEEPTFHPASVAEAMMYRGQHDADPGTYLDALVVSPLIMPVRAPADHADMSGKDPSGKDPSGRDLSSEDLGRDDFPWRVEHPDGVPTVAVFTSAQRMAEAIGEPTPVVPVELMAVARAWPDPSWQLAVNPHSAITATFAGAQLPDLIAWGLRLVGRQPMPGPVGTEAVMVGEPSIADLLRGSAQT